MAVPSRRLSFFAATALASALALTACVPSGNSGDKDTSSGDTSGSTQNSTVRVVVHDSFQLSDEQKASFTEKTGYDLEIVTNGDGGALVNKLILTKDSPLGDVAYGVDNTFASRGLDENVFAPYTSTVEGEQGKSMRIAGDDTLTAVDYGDVCLNIDSDHFATVDLVEPLEKDGFFNPANAGLAVVTNPATSSPGLSFLLATISKYGEDGYLDYWKQLKDNGLKIVDGWEDAYYVDFTATGDGDRPVVLSYASSPAVTLTEDGSRTTTEALLDTCFRQVEYAGVLEGAQNPEGAQAFIDYLLSDEYQNTIPGAMYMYPVSDTATLPDDWAKFAPVPQSTNELDPALIAKNRDQWIKDWSAAIIG